MPPTKYHDGGRSTKAISSVTQMSSQITSVATSSRFDRSDTGLSGDAPLSGGYPVEAWPSARRAYEGGDEDDVDGLEEEDEEEEEDDPDPHEVEEDEENGFDDDIEEDGDEEDDDDRSEESVRHVAQPGWQPTRTRLPHWIQLHLPRSSEGESTWRALELEQRDFQNNTPKVMEVSVGRLAESSTSSGSLPLPVTSLR